MKYLLAILLATTLLSCYKPGKIEVVNNIDNVEIIDVKWGDVYIVNSLLPGESSEKVTVLKSEEKLPSVHSVSFKMSANGRIIFLETKGTYSLDQDETISIILDDNTGVKNNN